MTTKADPLTEQEEEQERLAAQFADKLTSFAIRAGTVMTTEAVWLALVTAAVGFAGARGVPEAAVCNGLRRVADRLEQTDPPAPTVN